MTDRFYFFRSLRKLAQYFPLSTGQPQANEIVNAASSRVKLSTRVSRPPEIVAVTNFRSLLPASRFIHTRTNAHQCQDSGSNVAATVNVRSCENANQSRGFRRDGSQTSEVDELCTAGLDQASGRVAWKAGTAPAKLFSQATSFGWAARHVPPPRKSR